MPNSLESRPGRDGDENDDDFAPDPRAVAVHLELFFGGSKSAAELIVALGGQGFSLTEDDLEDMLDAGEVPHVVELTDGDEPLFVALDSLLQGRWFTHRLSAGEIHHHVLTIEPDLKPLMALTDAPPFDRLEDGSPIAEVFSGESVDPAGSLRVPVGLLSAARPGDLIAVGVGPGGLRIQPVGEVGPAPAELATRVSAIVGRTSVDRTDLDGTRPEDIGLSGDSPEDDRPEDDSPEDDRPEDDREQGDGDEAGLPLMLDELIWQICEDELDAFTEPLPPLTELLSSWGLDRSGDIVAPAGFDFSTWGVGHRLAEIAESYGLTVEQASAVLLVRSAFLDVLRVVDEHAAAGDATFAASSSGSAEALLEVSGVPLELADAAVADAVLWETVGEGVREAVALGALVESWEPVATRRVRPALSWLRGKSLERLGRILQAEAAFDESLSLDPTFVNALIDMSRYAMDRGDAARAISLLERAGFTAEDPVVGQLRQYLPVERMDVGRNDPCWCGSGRKYKRCHLGRAELGPSEQAAWLYEKAVNFAHDAPNGELLLELAAIRAEALGSDPMEAATDRAVLDVTLFEGGVLADFLETRGVLLPAAEQLIAASWQVIERSVFEVTASRPGTSVTLQDLRTGDTHDVPDALMSKSVKMGDLLCTRLLPVGDTVEIHSSAEPVPLHLLDWTLEVLSVTGDEELDPYELMSALSARFAPPRLNNGEGDPLVLCAAEFEITAEAIDHVIGVLNEQFGQADGRGTTADEGVEPDGPVSTWTMTAPAAIGERILASLTLTGTRLQVASSSERRFGEAMAVVRAADSDAAVLSETRTPAAEAMEGLGAAKRQDSAGPTDGTSPFADPTDPAIAEALATLTADYETRWLDMEIPALAGLTPRQAAVDPTRREDLVRLLRSFEGFTSGPGTMDVTRLREELGL